jgi:hypothetical protein
MQIYTMKNRITRRLQNQTTTTRPLAALGALLLGALAACNLTAAPITLYSNSFDSYSGAATNFSDTQITTLPNGAGGIRVEDGLAQGDSPYGAGWDGVQLINWNSAPSSSPNSMLLRPATAFRCTFDPRGGSNYVWDFWMLSFKSGTADRGFRISLTQQGADQNAHDFLIFRSGQGTTTAITGTDGVDILQAFDGRPSKTWTTMSNTVAGTPAFITNNIWTHYKIVANGVDRTFDFYVDDMVTPKCTGYSLSRPQNLVVSEIRFAHEGNSADDGYTLIDNVSLTVDGNFINLASGTFTDGFEGYTASTSANVGIVTTDNDPGGPWVTSETAGVENGKAFLTNTVQVVDSSVTAPHSGNQCLMVSQQQTSGSTISWAPAANDDVKITWWAKVPPQAGGTVDQIWLRVSLYAWEADYSAPSDTILIGYGHRQVLVGLGAGNSILTFSRWFNEWFNNGQWGDTLGTYTADTWEEYQLTTDVKHNSYTLVKNPSSTPVVIIKDGQYISSWVGNRTFHTVAFSTSNGGSTATPSPAAYIDDVTVEPYTNTEAPQPKPYAPAMPGGRFTNYTVVNVPGHIVGGVTVDPQDTNTIIFTTDDEVAGAIRKATKVASGNWVLDPTPIVSGLNNPNGLTMETNGNLWFVLDAVKGGQACGLRRLKAPWASNVVEEIVTDFGFAPTNRQDQPCDVVPVPAAFTGTTPMMAVLDRGVDASINPNAIWLVDPTTTSLNQMLYSTPLVQAPDSAIFGNGSGGNANAIAFLDGVTPGGELVTVHEGTGLIATFTSAGQNRYIDTTAASITFGEGIAVDPTTSRVWVSDNKNNVTPSAFVTNRITSFDSAVSSPGPFAEEIIFPNTSPSADRPDRRVYFHEPGMTFSQDGAFLVVSDQSLSSHGGRLLIFHNQAFTIPAFTITSVNRSGSTVNLAWQSAGGVTYDVQRATVVTGPYTSIGTTLNTQFTDSSSPAGNAYYRVSASPQD